MSPREVRSQRVVIERASGLGVFRSAIDAVTCPFGKLWRLFAVVGVVKIDIFCVWPIVGLPDIRLLLCDPTSILLFPDVWKP